jgi:hypothetical protein
MRRLLRVALLLAVAALAACNLTNEALPTLTPTPDMPTIQFLFPANESTVVEGADLNIDIVAEDSGIGVAKIQLMVDEQVVNERGPDISAAVPVFTVRMNWLAQGQGRHILTAVAFRPDGTQSDEANILVNVLPPDGDITALTPQATEEIP